MPHTQKRSTLDTMLCCQYPELLIIFSQGNLYFPLDPTNYVTGPTLSVRIQRYLVRLLESQWTAVQTFFKKPVGRPGSVA